MDAFLEKLRRARERHVEELIKAPDAEALKAVQIRNIIRGLDEAKGLYEKHVKAVDEE